MVHAEGRANAWTDALLLTGFDLPDDVRVGDVGARHAHHVDHALADNAARSSGIDDAAGMEGRQCQFPGKRLDPVEVGRLRCRHARPSG